MFLIELYSGKNKHNIDSPASQRRVSAILCRRRRRRRLRRPGRPGAAAARRALRR